MTNRPRILIADEGTLLAELCKQLLEREFVVIGVVGDGRALVHAACELRPEIILLEVALPMLNGLDAGQQVKSMFPAVKLIYWSMNSKPEVAVEAFSRGASGYLLKTCSADEMLVAVSEVSQGKTYLSRGFSRDSFNLLRWQNKDLTNESERLTVRQREVLQLLAEGKVMKEVGFILNMTARTVAFHKYRIMEVLGARSNAELVKYALRNNMVAN